VINLTSSASQILNSVVSVIGRPGFDLLPVAGREAERDHVLLAVAALAPELADPLP
jgi:hypothetical protein